MPYAGRSRRFERADEAFAALDRRGRYGRSPDIPSGRRWRTACALIAVRCNRADCRFCHDAPLILGSSPHQAFGGKRSTSNLECSGARRHPSHSSGRGNAIEEPNQVDGERRALGWIPRQPIAKNFGRLTTRRPTFHRLSIQVDDPVLGHSDVAVEVALLDAVGANATRR